MIVAVVRLALDGEEQVAGLKRAGVDRHAARRARRAARSARPASRSVRLRVHNASVMPPPRSAARATSASENGSVRSPDDLAGFMTLAGDHQRVARRRASRSRRGSPRARSPISRAPGAAARMAARIAAGSSERGLSSVTIDDVGAARRDRAHHRPLAGVAVAAAAEDDDEPAATKGRKRRERLFQRVGLVRVIDEDRRAVLLADPLEPARRALRASPARRTPPPGRCPSTTHSPAATSALETWKSPGSGSRAR